MMCSVPSVFICSSGHKVYRKLCSTQCVDIYSMHTEDSAVNVGDDSGPAQDVERYVSLAPTPSDGSSMNLLIHTYNNTSVILW